MMLTMTSVLTSLVTVMTSSTTETLHVSPRDQLFWFVLLRDLWFGFFGFQPLTVHTSKVEIRLFVRFQEKKTVLMIRTFVLRFDFLPLFSIINTIYMKNHLTRIFELFFLFSLVILS